MATEIFLRIDFDDYGAIGPWRMRLLENIRGLSSIAEAAREMRVTYRQAWLAIRTLNRMFREPLVITERGRKGGAFLTPLGKDVLAIYRDAYLDASKATNKYLEALSRLRAQ